jgi:hypothetical protein
VLVLALELELEVALGMEQGNLSIFRNKFEHIPKILTLGPMGT